MKRALVILYYVLPTVFLSSLGILILVFQRAGFDIVFGTLILILAVAVLSGGIVLHGALSAQVRMAKLQTDFVAKVSHELRTPLASIRLFVDTLQGDAVKDPEEVSMCLGVISTETSRLTKIIERLLSWGRMEAGRRTYEKRPELAAALVGEALAQLETQLHGSGVEVELEIEDQAAGVMADREAIVETLLNLMSNAIKYGGSGGKLIVRVRRARQPGRVLFEVEDLGPGIPRSEQQRIFEKFYRGETSVAAQTKGSGLGLAMARHVVRAHKGRIRLRSEPGEGTRFTIDLPALPPGVSPMEVPPG
jgi:two-component system phosphate regulon sensor histidine kinase PhoR